MDKIVKVPYQGKTVDGVDLEFKTKSEGWNEYETSDGSVIRIKVIASNIVRIEGESDQEGNPIYAVKSTNVMAVSPPGKLRKRTNN